MKTYHLVPISLETNENVMGYPDSRLQRIHWSYLHGTIETKNGYDIYMAVDDAPTTDGIYPCFVEFPDEKVPCTLFMWRANEFKDTMGFVVANDDDTHLKDAKVKYDNKEYSI